MNSSVLQPIRDGNAARSTRSSTASILSCASTVKATNRDIMRTNMSNRSILTESQKDSFHAVWNGMNRHGRRHLILNLQLLVEDEGNQDAREQTLSTMEHHLVPYTNVSAEHGTNVSNFVAVLTGLSAQATREMLSLAEAQRPTEIVLQEGNERDVSILTPASHEASGSAMAVASGTTTFFTELNTTASDTTTYFTALDTTASDTTTFFTALDTTASDATTYFTAMDPTVSGTTTTAPSTAESNSDHDNSVASS